MKLTRYTIQGMDYSKDKVQTPITNAIENTAIKIADFELEINNDIAELIDMKNKATKTINNIQGIYGTILEMRYLECMRWEEIAYRLNYSIQRIYQLHGQALLEIKTLE